MYAFSIPFHGRGCWYGMSRKWKISIFQMEISMWKEALVMSSVIVAICVPPLASRNSRYLVSSIT